ncbi:uncharacterized protein LOC115368389 isoform X2 [Myripristis murdjan]|uniref:uncharacterized protein LOC115368389 isoform X2 n=1 Tax=Myripristis murdjan TaxID=586833 RepID=UPI00117628C3|nr:uncharacterized protein LOC115368389 isoform X2 [Myripristis murdjan]
MGRCTIACQGCLLTCHGIGELKKHLHTKRHRQQMRDLFQTDMFRVRGSFPFIAIMEHLAKHDLHHPIIGLSLVTLCLTPKLRTTFYLCHVCETKCSHSDILHHLFSDEHYSNYYNFTDPNVLSFCWIPSLDMRNTLKDKVLKEIKNKGCGQLQVLDLPENLFSAVEARTYSEVMHTLNENKKIFNLLEADKPKRVMIQTYQKDVSRSHPLLGLQHIVECVCVGQTEKRHYLCTLCRLTFATHKIIKHVLSFHHIFYYFNVWHPSTLLSKESYSDYTKAFVSMMLDFAKQAEEIHGPATSDVKQVSLEPDLFAEVVLSCYAEALKKLEGHMESGLITSITPGNKLVQTSGHTATISLRLRCQDCNMIFGSLAKYCTHLRSWDHKQKLSIIFRRELAGADLNRKACIPLLGLCKHLRRNRTRTEPVIGIPLIVLCLSTQVQVEPFYVCFACEETFSNTLIKEHLHSPKHHTHTLMRQNHGQLPFAWEESLDGNVLCRLAWEEERTRGTNDMMLKIFDVPQSLFDSINPNCYEDVMKKLRPFMALFKCQVPKFDKAQQRQTFPLLGQEFLVKHFAYYQTHLCGFLCLLCHRKLTEQEFYVHAFSREHVKAFLELVHPGSLDSHMENTETLLDLAKQAANLNPACPSQVIRLRNPIMESFSYHKVTNILKIVKKKCKEGPLRPTLIPKKKLVPTKTLKEDKHQVRDTSQNNDVTDKKTGKETDSESPENNSETNTLPVPVKKDGEPESTESSEQMKNSTGDGSDMETQGSVSCRPQQKRRAGEDAQEEVESKRQRLCSEDDKTPLTEAQKIPEEGQIETDSQKMNTTNMGQSGKSTDETETGKDKLCNYVKMTCREPVIGLSSLFECNCDQYKPLYLCESCHMKIPEENIISHVTGYGHQMMHLGGLQELPASPEKTEKEKIRCSAFLQEQERGYGEAQAVDLDAELFNDIEKQDFYYAITKVKQLLELPQTSGIPGVEPMDTSAVTSEAQDTPQSQVNPLTTQTVKKSENKDPRETTADLLTFLNSSDRTEPIIGLNMLTKTHSGDGEKRHYLCKCCSIKMAISSCIGHLTSSQHRYNYIKLMHPEQADKWVKEPDLTTEEGQLHEELREKAAQLEKLEHRKLKIRQTERGDAGSLERQPKSATATTSKTDDSHKTTEAISESIEDSKITPVQFSSSKTTTCSPDGLSSKNVATSDSSVINLKTKVISQSAPVKSKSATSSKPVGQCENATILMGTTSTSAANTFKSTATPSSSTAISISTAATSKSMTVTSELTTTSTTSVATSSTPAATSTMSSAPTLNAASNPKSAVVSKAQTTVRTGAASMSGKAAATPCAAAPQSNRSPKTCENVSKSMVTTTRGSNAHGHHKGDTPVSLTQMPVRSVHKTAPTDTSEYPRSVNRPNQSKLLVGVNYLIIVKCEKKQQIYCQLCSLRVKDSNHIQRSSHRYKYVKHKFPEWTVEPAEKDRKLLELVTHLAMAERDAGLREKKVEVNYDEYREIARLPEQTAIDKLKAIIKEREMLRRSSSTTNPEQKDQRRRVPSSITNKSSHPDDGVPRSNREGAGLPINCLSRQENMQEPQHSVMETKSREDRNVTLSDPEKTASLTPRDAAQAELSPDQLQSCHTPETNDSEPLKTPNTHSSDVNGTVKEDVSEPDVMAQPQVNITSAPGHPEEKPHESPDHLDAESETPAPAVDTQPETSENQLQREQTDTELPDTCRPPDGPEKMSLSSDPVSPSSIVAVKTAPQTSDLRQTGGHAWNHTGHRLEQDQTNAPHVVPTNSTVIGERPAGCSRLSTYLMVKQLETEPIIGMGFVFECRGQSLPSFYLCGSCSKTILLKDIFEHIVSTEHQLQYMLRQFPHFMYWWDWNLQQEEKLQLLTEIAWILSDREKHNKTDAQVTLLDEDWHGRVQTVPYCEALKMLQHLRREQNLSPLCLPASDRIVAIKKDSFGNMTPNDKKEELQPSLRELRPEAKSPSEEFALTGDAKRIKQRISSTQDTNYGNSDVYSDVSVYPAVSQKTNKNLATKPAEIAQVSLAHCPSTQTQPVLHMKQPEVLSECPSSFKFCLKSSQASVSSRDEFSAANPTPAKVSVGSFVSPCFSNSHLNDLLEAESTRSSPQPSSQTTPSSKPAVHPSQSTLADTVVNPSPLCPNDKDTGTFVDMHKFNKIIAMLRDNKSMSYLPPYQDSPKNTGTATSSTIDLPKNIAQDKESCNSTNGLSTSELCSASIPTLMPAHNPLKRKLSPSQYGESILNYENRQFIANPSSVPSTDNQSQDGSSGQGNHLTTVVRDSTDTTYLPNVSTANTNVLKLPGSIFNQSNFGNVLQTTNPESTSGYNTNCSLNSGDSQFNHRPYVTNSSSYSSSEAVARYIAPYVFPVYSGSSYINEGYPTYLFPSQTSPPQGTGQVTAEGSIATPAPTGWLYVPEQQQYPSSTHTAPGPWNCQS